MYFLFSFTPSSIISISVSSFKPFYLSCSSSSYFHSSFLPYLCKCLDCPRDRLLLLLPPVSYRLGPCGAAGTAGTLWGRCCLDVGLLVHPSYHHHLHGHVSLFQKILFFPFQFYSFFQPTSNSYMVKGTIA